MSVKIFFCYAHEDEDLLNKLKRHLWPFQRQGLIAVWHDRDISAGTEWEREISQHLNAAQIILLLVSPDFMYSEYCYGVEMKRALERHERKEAIVIPIIMRPIYWQGVLGNIQALPTDAKPIMDRYWHTLDEALYDVAEGIRKVVVQLSTPPVSLSEVPTSQAANQESADVSLNVLTPQRKAEEAEQARKAEEERIRAIYCPSCRRTDTIRKSSAIVAEGTWSGTAYSGNPYQGSYPTTNRRQLVANLLANEPRRSARDSRQWAIDHALWEQDFERQYYCFQCDRVFYV